MCWTAIHPQRIFIKFQLTTCPKMLSIDVKNEGLSVIMQLITWKPPHKTLSMHILCRCDIMFWLFSMPEENPERSCCWTTNVRRLAHFGFKLQRWLDSKRKKQTKKQMNTIRLNLLAAQGFSLLRKKNAEENIFFFSENEMLSRSCLKQDFYCTQSN